MRLRPYIPETDFEKISKWIKNERTHAMWSANRFPFPIEKESFHAYLSELGKEWGGSPFVFTEDDGTVRGFFCYETDLKSNVGMLKYIVVDDSVRGRGYGGKMLKLAAKYAFEICGADGVHLNVFTVNAPARRCYEKAGFAIRSIDEGAFKYNDEQWGRCNMYLAKDKAK